MDGRNSPFRIRINAVCTHPQSALTNLETTEWKMGTGESVKQRIQYSKCEIGWTRVKIDNVERDRWRIIMKERESDRREKKTQRDRSHANVCTHHWYWTIELHTVEGQKKNLFIRKTLCPQLAPNLTLCAQSVWRLGFPAAQPVRLSIQAHISYVIENIMEFWDRAELRGLKRDLQDSNLKDHWISKARRL